MVVIPCQLICMYSKYSKPHFQIIQNIQRQEQVHSYTLTSERADHKKNPKPSTACCLQMEIMALLEIEIGQMKVVGSFLDSSNCSIPGWGPVVEFSRNIGIPRRPIITGVGQETTIEAIFDLNGLSHPGGIGVSLHGVRLFHVWVINIMINVIATSMIIQNIWSDLSIVCCVHALSGLDQLWGQVESFMPPLCKSKCRVLWHHPPLLLKALILHTHIALLTEPWLVGFHNPLADGSDFFQVKWGPCLSHDNTKVEGTGRMAFFMWFGGQQGP